MKRNIIRFTTFWVTILSLSPYAHGMVTHKIYLTASAQDGVVLTQPTTKFGCGDRIAAVIEVGDLTEGTHKIDAVWRDPRGKDRERTGYEFASVDSTKRILVWLKLHRSMETAVVSFLNPSAGMDEFIGEWELRVAIDGRLIDKKSFSVLC